MSFALPLGWSWGRVERRRSVPLASGPVFIHSAVLSNVESESALLDQLAKENPGGFVFKSCDREFLDRAGVRKSSRLLLAHSARIALQGFRVPKKVRQLAGKAEGIPITEESVETTARELYSLASVLFPGGQPVRYFYRLEPEVEDRCFIARSDAGTAGIVTMSRYAPDGWHVDLLLRHPEAPPGVMEQLILHVIKVLADDGITMLNLGEVPLVAPSDAQSPAPPSKRELRAARWGAQIAALVAPLYNIAGLYQFKNKFEPIWEPRYYVGIPKLRLRDLKAFGFASGALAILDQALRK